MKIIRIDDISLNTNFINLNNILKLFDEKFKNVKFLLGVSPLIFTMSDNQGIKKERVFPSILNAFSDHRLFYKVHKCGIPPELMNIVDDGRYKIILAGHGIVHVDHRLLNYQVQELSIIASCSLVDTKIFIPPFNKWNKDTEIICCENDIELIKFEDGWSHLLYNNNIINTDKLYFHTHDLTIQEIEKILNR